MRLDALRSNDEVRKQCRRTSPSHLDEGINDIVAIEYFGLFFCRILMCQTDHVSD